MEYRTILVRGNQKSFGLKFDDQNVVTEILSDGPADLTGQIQVGDRIHAINNEILSDGSDTYNTLINCGTTANMIMKRVTGK